MSRAGWFAVLGCAAAVVGALVFVPPEWIVDAEARLTGARVWLGGLRVAAIVAAWVWWDTLVAAVPRLGADGMAYLRGRRRFWIGALAAVELVLVRNVPGTLWSLA